MDIIVKVQSHQRVLHPLQIQNGIQFPERWCEISHAYSTNVKQLWFNQFESNVFGSWMPIGLIFS